jgi:hypothetical protein
VWCSHYKSGKEILYRGRGIGIVDEGRVGDERVRSEEHEIQRGEGFWPAKPKYECTALVSSLGKKSFTGVEV